jgi:hypothetical protein
MISFVLDPVQVRAHGVQLAFLGRASATGDADEPDHCGRHQNGRERFHPTRRVKRVGP